MLFIWDLTRVAPHWLMPQRHSACALTLRTVRRKFCANDWQLANARPAVEFMRTKLFPWVLLFSLAVLVVAAAQAAQEKVAGKIVAAKVRGTVTAVNKADNSSRALRDSDALSEGYVVNTAPNSSVVLLFANGSAVNLGADTSLSIDEFLMDPFDAKYSAAEAKEEPSTSVTKLDLKRGEFVANVKHLNRDQGSAFTINTPVGAAGIRGTTFQITIGTDGSGKPFVRISTSEGLVALITADGTEQLIPAGKELSVSFEFATGPNGLRIVVPGSVRITGLEDMPPETQAAIAQAVLEIIQASPAFLNLSGVAPDALPPPVNTTPADGK